MTKSARDAVVLSRLMGSGVRNDTFVVDFLGLSGHVVSCAGLCVVPIEFVFDGSCGIAGIVQFDVGSMFLEVGQAGL